MTEAEWLACEKPEEMLLSFGNMGTERKWRLAVCSICRLAWHLLTDERSRTSVEAAELSADDDIIRRQRVRLAFNDAGEAANAVESIDQAKYEAASAVVSAMHASTSAITVGHLWDVFNHVARATGEITSYPRQATLIRDIFGNPFRTITLDPAWLTSTVVTLAQQMYDSRDFTAMPILADALMDAGCDDEQVLTHCRGGGVHVRGCFVVDLVTGRQ
jgi:hypothetical protein